MGNLGMMGAGATLAACTRVRREAQTPDDDDYDAAILNFALNLEYLEAAFYLGRRRAASPSFLCYSADGFVGTDGFAVTPSAEVDPASMVTTPFRQVFRR